jgi:hypothetical protein
VTSTDLLPATAPSAAPATVSRRDVLLRPAAAGAIAGVLAVAVTALLVLGGVPRSSGGELWSVAAAVVLVLAFSGLTGWVMTAVSSASPITLLAVALGSYVAKIAVFGVAAAVASTIPGFSALAFALGGTVTLICWLVVEAVGVLRAPELRAETFRAPAADGRERA